MSTIGTVTRLIVGLKRGDKQAAQEIWEIYFKQLVALAKKKSLRLPRPSAESDEEDVALSAINSLVVGAADGKFPRLDDRDNLWRLLVTITTCKSIKQYRRQTRFKRGLGKVIPFSALGRDSGREVAPDINQIISGEPTPEFVVSLEEEHQRLLALLRDDTLRRIVVLKMEGRTNEEIADDLHCVRQTITRKLELIRETWKAGGGFDDGRPPIFRA